MPPKDYDNVNRNEVRILELKDRSNKYLATAPDVPGCFYDISI